jgi:hypothetical protein
MRVNPIFLDKNSSANTEPGYVSENHFENLQYFLENEMDNLCSTYRNFNCILDKLDEKLEPNNLIGTYKKQDITLDSCILDLNKTNYCILEKYVYDIAKFHFSRLNMPFTAEDCAIEFNISKDFKKNRPLHYDHQHTGDLMFDFEGLPFLSSVTYFDDSIYPTVITNMKNKDYVDFDNNELFVSFPQPGKHIVFDGGKYFHGSANVFDKQLDIRQKREFKKTRRIIGNKRYILTIFFWNKKLDFIPTFKCAKEVPYNWTKEDELLIYKLLMNFY